MRKPGTIVRDIAEGVPSHRFPATSWRSELMVGIDTLQRDRYRPAPGFGERHSLAAEWTVGRVVVVSSKLKERFEPRWER